MSGVIHLPAFIAAALMVIFSPGPGTLYVAGQVQHSLPRAWQATAGVVIGDLLLIALSALGFAALIARWPVLLDIFKIGGALYLLWLGVAMYRTPPLLDSGSAAPGNLLRAVLITVTNPKPILFFGAFFPLFIDHGAGGTLRSFMLLGVLFEIMNVLYFAGVIALVARLRGLRAPGRLGGLPLHKLSGGGLMLCAAFVLLA